jgi:ABC-type sugar transport system ATPase subunit
MAAAVRFEHVHKRFGDVVAIHELTLDVEEGEFMVLVGPSGSGKTTALRLLAGLEALSAGHVYVGERRVDRLPPKRRDIAMVCQDYALYPQMSVYDNLAFGLRMANVTKDEIRRRVDAAAAALELGDLLRRKPRQLSGGQRQRVALGRALVRQPQAFLMDEPLSNLDAKLRVQTRGEIKRLQEEVGTTTVYVTHDQVEAMTMGHRIAVMSEGRLEQVGDPDTVYHSPVNTFVAGFVGSPAMSLNDVSVAAADGRVTLAHDRSRLELDRPAFDLPPTATLGVRPEHARLWQEGAGLVGPLEGVVLYVEALGRETFIGVETAGGARYVLEADGTTRVPLGDPVRFGFVPGKLHLFHAETGLALGRM